MKLKSLVVHSIFLNSACAFNLGAAPPCSSTHKVSSMAPRRSDGDARVVATAVYANNQCVIYRRKYLRGEYKDLVDRRYVLEQSKIPHKLRKIQAVQAVLDLNPHG